MTELAIEERVSSLEYVLESFILSTHVMIREIRNENEKMKQDTASFKTSVEQTVADMKQDTVSFKAKVDQTIADMKQDTVSFKAKMDETVADMKREAKRMNKQWGDLANKWGTIVEDIVVPNFQGVASQYFQVDTFDSFAIRVRRRHSRDRKKIKEFDIIATSDTCFFLNETKSTPRMSYVENFIAATQTIFDYFPEHSDKRLIPIFACLSMPPDVEQVLTANRIYAMSMKEDTMDLINFEALLNNG